MGNDFLWVKIQCGGMVRSNMESISVLVKSLMNDYGCLSIR